MTDIVEQATRDFEERQKVANLSLGRAVFAHHDQHASQDQLAWLAFPVPDAGIAYVCVKKMFNDSRLHQVKHHGPWSCNSVFFFDNEVDLWDFVSKDSLIRECEREDELENDTYEGGVAMGATDSVKKAILAWLRP